jgi:hypothetical protein
MEHKEPRSHHNTDRERHNTHPECSGTPSIAKSTICVSLCASQVLSYISKFLLYNNFVVKIMPVNEGCDTCYDHMLIDIADLYSKKES